eukprot:7024805-Prymnesium_polylepis.1
MGKAWAARGLMDALGSRARVRRSRTIDMKKDVSQLRHARENQADLALLERDLAGVHELLAPVLRVEEVAERVERVARVEVVLVGVVALVALHVRLDDLVAGTELLQPHDMRRLTTPQSE